MYAKLSAIATVAPKRLALLALIVVAVAVAVPLAQAGSASHKSPATHSCRTGNAPLPDGASVSKTSGAGLAARGWDSWSAKGSRNC